MGISFGVCCFSCTLNYRPDALLPAVLSRCPSLIILPMDTDFYRSKSLQLRHLIETAPVWRHSAPIVEQSSIDDFYIDITAEVQAEVQIRLQPTMPTAMVTATKGVQMPPTFTDVESLYCPAAAAAAAAAVEDPAEFALHEIVAANIVSALRKDIENRSGGMTLSCGIASNKLSVVYDGGGGVIAPVPVTSATIIFSRLCFLAIFSSLTPEYIFRSFIFHIFLFPGYGIT